VPELYAAVGFLYHRESGRVLLHHRDANAPTLPNVWAGFGGLSEPGDGTDLVTTWQREMREELSIELGREQIMPLRTYLSPYSGRPRSIFYALWPTLDTSAFVLGEGDGFGWFALDEAITLPDIMDLARDDLLALREIVGKPTAADPVEDDCRPSI
jgi:8-oxo-dGTP pyrophosphatase MutT (NUDIX family)